MVLRTTCGRCSPVAVAIVLFAWIISGAPAPARADGCADYASHIRWLWGDNFGWYAPGYGSEAFAHDVARGNLLFLAHETGLYAYSVVDPLHPVGTGEINVVADRLDTMGDQV